MTHVTMQTTLVAEAVGFFLPLGPQCILSLPSCELAADPLALVRPSFRRLGPDSSAPMLARLCEALKGGLGASKLRRDRS